MICISLSSLCDSLPPLTPSLPPLHHSTSLLFQIDHRLSDSCLQEKQNKATKRCRAQKFIYLCQPSLRPFPHTLPPLPAPLPHSTTNSGQLPHAKRQLGNWVTEQLSSTTQIIKYLGWVAQATRRILNVLATSSAKYVTIIRAYKHTIYEHTISLKIQ